MIIKLVDEIIMDLEEAIKYLESATFWRSGVPEEIFPSGNEGVMIIYLKELIESVKKLRTIDIPIHEKHGIVDHLVTKIIFWKDIFLRIDFEKFPSVKDKAFEELVRAETQLIHLRDIIKEEMGR